jgi:hypothetical protein
MWSAAWEGFVRLFPRPPMPAVVGRWNGVLGALTIPLVYQLGRRLTASEAPALAAAAAAAFLPALIKSSVGSGPQALGGLLFVAGTLQLLEWADSGAKRSLLLAGLFLAIGVDLRPEGLVGATAALLIAVGIARKPWRALPLTGFAPLLLLPAGLILWLPLAALLSPVTEGQAVAGVWSGFGPFVLLRTPGTHQNALQPFWYSSLAFVGVGALALSWRKPRAAVCLWLSAGLLSINQEAICPLKLASLRYVFLFLLVQATLVGVGVASLALLGWRLLARGSAALRRVAPAAAAGVSVLALLVPLYSQGAELCWSWAHTTEYETLLRGLRALPDDCTVIADLEFHHELGLVIYRQASVVVNRRHHWREIADFVAEHPPVESCHAVWLGAGCFIRHDEADPFKDDIDFEDERPVCAAIRARFALQPLAEGRAPFRSYVGNRATRQDLHFGLYRIDSQER